MKKTARKQLNTHNIGAEWEEQALHYLQANGLQLVTRNYRCKCGEIDLILSTTDQTLVFVEVRARQNSQFGGAVASITASKQAKLRRTAEHFLLSCHPIPPCRFDVLAFEGQQPVWIQNAF
jgi:putative endonuclease